MIFHLYAAFGGGAAADITMSGDFSFVNENFDELQSQGSKENVQQGEVPESSQKSSDPPSLNPTTDTVTQVLPDGDLTPEERDEGVAVLHLSNEEPQSHSKGECDLFTPDKSPVPSPLPRTKYTKPLVAPSSAVASMDKNGLEEDDENHRPLPDTQQYESLIPHNKANELRHEDSDEEGMDLQVCLGL